MKPVRATVDVPFPRERVYEFLAVSANHEQFNRHMLTDWSFGGPPRGVGSTAHATATLGGRREEVDIETVEDVAPELIVERNVGAAGKRVATGTYTLVATEAGTAVTFEYAWQSAPLSERLAAPVVRRVMRSALERSMRELGVSLAAALAPSEPPHA
jgi:carbon monoxide dehydrogenase subunit G